MIDYEVRNYKTKVVYLENEDMCDFQDMAWTLYELRENLDNNRENYELKGETEKVTKADIETAERVMSLLAENDMLIVKPKK